MKKMIFVFLLLAYVAYAATEISGSITFNSSSVENLSFTVTGNTTTSTSTTSTTSTSTTTTTTILSNSSLEFMTYNSSLEISQGFNKSASYTINNTGILTQENITISLNGLDKTFYTIDSNLSNLSANETGSFIVKYIIPENATVKVYVVEVTASANASATATVQIKVLPNNASKLKINETYLYYMSLMPGIRENITILETRGKDVESLWVLYNTTEDMLNQTKTAIDNDDYFRANELLESVGKNIDDLITKIQQMFSEAEVPWLYIIVGIITVVVVGFLVYLLWPVKEEVIE